MDIRKDDWLGNLLGCDAFTIVLSQTISTDVLERTVKEHLSQQKKAFYSLRLPTENVILTSAFSRLGAHVIDTTITFQWAANNSEMKHSTNCEVSAATAKDAEAVLEIAETSFRYSRFHLDPQIPNTVANRIKKEWIRSYLEGRRGEKLLVARLEGKPVGFLAVIAGREGDETQKIIDLVATKLSHQGRGVGAALVSTFIHDYRSQAGALLVGTQGANIPSLRFYEGQGFRVRQTQFVLHLHAANGMAS